MLCQNCGKNEANVRYTQIINGVKTEIALCSNCARKSGMDRIDIPDFPLNFHSILGDFFSDFAESSLLPTLQGTAVKCKNCGTTYDDFIDTGMFGCSDCYDTFEAPIDLLLKKLHGTAKHIGRKSDIGGKDIKVEKRKVASNNENSKKVDLQKELEKAISEERYEDAARIRDELKKENNN